MKLRSKKDAAKKATAASNGQGVEARTYEGTIAVYKKEPKKADSNKFALRIGLPSAMRTDGFISRGRSGLKLVRKTAYEWLLEPDSSAAKSVNIGAWKNGWHHIHSSNDSYFSGLPVPFDSSPLSLRVVNPNSLYAVLDPAKIKSRKSAVGKEG